MGRKPRVTGPEAIERSERLAAILSMRMEGVSLKDIGAAQSPPVTAQAIHKCILKALREQVREAVDCSRSIELLRLDELMAGIYGKALDGDVAAVDRVLAISFRRAKLLGLDVWFGPAPVDEFAQPAVEVQVVGGPDPDHVRRLERRLHELEGSDPPRTIRVG